MTIAATSRWAERARNPRLPLYLRIVAYAEAKAGDNLHAPLLTGELRKLDPTMHTSHWSRAINRAIDVGLLDATSTSRCLVLPGNPPSRRPCPAIHRRTR